MRMWKKFKKWYFEPISFENQESRFGNDVAALFDVILLLSVFIGLPYLMFWLGGKI